MNPLRTLENMIAGLVEGTFGRVFKTEVRPMELARKLAREMDENTTVSVSRVYAPNEYSVWLSRKDRARYEGVEDEVIDELCAYLLEHARGEDLALASRPSIKFHTDERLALGEFGIEAKMARTEEGAGQQGDRPRSSASSVERPSSAAPAGAASGHNPPYPAESARPAPPRGAAMAESAALAGGPPREQPEEAGNTMIFSNSKRVRDAVEGAGGRRASRAFLIVSGRRVLVPPRGADLGRSRDCDVVIEDSGVSRRHAELRPEGTVWRVEDLGSTNGVRVNGLAIHGAHQLRSGDRIEMGSTEMLFEVAP
jgi:hypothetical protein